MLERTDHQESKAGIAPHSVEAEQAVLGSILLDNGLFDQISTEITTQDFYQPAHRLIFETMGRLMQQNIPVDLLTLTENLRQHASLDSAGGAGYLAQLSDNASVAVNLSAYTGIIAERSTSRRLISAANTIAEMTFNPQGKTSEQLLDEAERLVFAIADQNVRHGEMIRLDDLLTLAMNKIEQLFANKKAVTGLATGFPDLDRMTSGLQPADFIVIAGRPSMGKTSLIMTMVEHALMQDEPLPVLVFSLEMPAVSLATRMLASMSRINQGRLRSGMLHDADWPRLTSTISILRERPLLIDDAPTLTPVEIRGRARRAARAQGKLGLIVIDYLQLMQTNMHSDNRVAEISAISRSLKALAREMDCPVVALSQLNRGVEQRPNKRPVMSDLRESGAIEQDADLIMFIYRDELYNPDSEDKGTAEIIISKQRNGPTGICRLAFLPDFTRFESLEPDISGGQTH